MLIVWEFLKFHDPLIFIYKTYLHKNITKWFHDIHIIIANAFFRLR